MNGGTPMRYPRYTSQPNAGNLPSMAAIGPIDHKPSAHNPYYDVYNMTRGRNLGSIGNTEPRAVEQLPSADRGIPDYPNELNSLTSVDDVSGNGIFDAPGTHGNIHPDEGVFTDSMNIPGYLAREVFFAPSEVVDINTGQPIMYVPGNAFMLDPRTQEVLNERALYEPGLPTTGGGQVAQEWTDTPNQPAWPVPSGWPTSGLGQEPTRSRTNLLVAAGIAGIAVGIFAATLWPRKAR